MAKVKFTHPVSVDGKHWRADEICDARDLSPGTLASLLYTRYCLPIHEPGSIDEPVLTLQPDVDSAGSIDSDLPVRGLPVRGTQTGLPVRQTGTQTDAHDVPPQPTTMPASIRLADVPGFPVRALDELAGVGVHTFDGLQQWIATNGKLTSIPGIGRATAKRILDAIAPLEHEP